jgi:hypothetical protein
MTYDLEQFGLTDMIDACRELRNRDESVESMEVAASRAVDLFYDKFRTGGLQNDQPACVLARCFRTNVIAELPSDVQRAILSESGHPGRAEMQYLTLLASRGEEAAWNGRRGSVAHQAIPLPTAEVVRRAPMISQLILQLGLEIGDVVDPSTRVEPAVQKAFEVFHVEDAVGSTMVPAQEFVRRYGVRSVIGFGGLLPAGELFAVILFARVRITEETAALFRTLALGVKLSLLPYSGKRVYESMQAST